MDEVGRKYFDNLTSLVDRFLIDWQYIKGFIKDVIRTNYSKEETTFWLK